MAEYQFIINRCYRYLSDSSGFYILGTGDQEDEGRKHLLKKVTFVLIILLLPTPKFKVHKILIFDIIYNLKVDVCFNRLFCARIILHISVDCQNEAIGYTSLGGKKFLRRIKPGNIKHGKCQS
ncbi:MAG: hypothetical protein MJK14_00240, partial [Rivularia sp. ALOHA_DT_140]|nr:hypothetical protein [Rivularia sp. ALOHA_DT_140]